MRSQGDRDDGTRRTTQGPSLPSEGPSWHLELGRPAPRARGTDSVGCGIQEPAWTDRAGSPEQRWWRLLFY